jgi:4'-phosphopantetheinyl transferase
MANPRADRPGLSIGEIHVWTVHLGDDDRVKADFLRILDHRERLRAAEFSFERDRGRFIQTHGAVRQILANYSGAAASTLAFERNCHGKPYLVPPAKGPNLQFSVAHSGNCCMLAVRLDHPVGVDVEKLRDLPKAINIAQSYFAPAESKILAALEGTAQRDAFFALWTHKEATVKGLGISLAAHLSRVEFDLRSVRRPRLAAWDGNQAIAQRWSILRLDPSPGYVAAVASVNPIQSLTLQNWMQRNDD